MKTSRPRAQKKTTESSQSNVPSCDICTEPYNKSDRKPIECDHCDMKACRTCYITFWKSNIETTKQMKCMSSSCTKLYDFEKMIEDRKFTIKDSRDIQGMLMKMSFDELERVELGQVPTADITTVRMLPRMKEISKLLTETESALTKKIHIIRTLQTLFERKSYQPFEQVHVDMTTLRYYNEYPEFVNSLINDDEIISEFFYLDTVENQEPSEPNDINVADCSMNDCKGFIKKSNYKCNVCRTAYCKSCMATMTDPKNHQCKVEDVKSLELIRKDSKKCPGCNALIHRYTGCPVMYCVLCHTAFNWNTMKLIKGSFHNPEHADMVARMRTNIRSDLVIDGCDVQGMYRYRTYEVKFVGRYINLLSHIHQTVQNIDADINRSNVRLIRAKYLAGQVSKEEYFKIVNDHYAKMALKEEISQALRSYVLVGIGFTNQLESSENRIDSVFYSMHIVAKLDKNGKMKEYTNDHYTYIDFYNDIYKMTKDYDVIVCNIYKKHGKTPIKHFKDISSVVDYFTGIRLSDVDTCDYPTLLKLGLTDKDLR